MPTHTDFRIGTLVRWYSRYEPDSSVDIDELGIVIQIPAGRRNDYYHISWAVSNTVSHHSPEMIEQSLYNSQMEIMG